MSGQMEQLKLELEVPQTEVPKAETNNTIESFEEARARIARENKILNPETITQKDGVWYVKDSTLEDYQKFWEDDHLERNNPFYNNAA